MLENLMGVLSRIQQIKSNFRRDAASGVVSVAPRPVCRTSSGKDELRPFFPDYLIGAIGNDTSDTPSASASSYDGLIEEAARKHGVDKALLGAVVQAESGFNSSAVSSKGARGLMQLMPGTAAALGVSDPFDPGQNIDGGARYLRQQLDRFGSVDLALAAYNAGPGAVVRYGGVPPFTETRNYIQRVLRYRAARMSG